jgi:ABC-2 type transport system ATP-binding protein
VAGDLITISIEKPEEKTDGLVSRFEQAEFIREVMQEDSHIRLYVYDGAKSISEVLNILKDQDAVLKTITLSATCLDDVFLRETGRSLRDINARGAEKL